MSQPTMASLPDTGNAQPEGFTPDLERVAVPASEYFRLEGIRVLTARYRELSERAKRRMPTPVERKELDRCHLALEALQDMAGGDGSI